MAPQAQLLEARPGDASRHLFKLRAVRRRQIDPDLRMIDQVTEQLNAGFDLF
jgi:hypothetical protein